MEFKSLLEQTGLKVKENRFLKAPSLPYIVFFDEQLHKGSDTGRTVIVDHNVTVELYVKNIEDKSDLIKVENVLDTIYVDYDRAIEWVEADSNFKVEYTFNYIEKKKRGAIDG